jgi:hypothetical protein
MKLKVKFINGWPVIGRIQISFVDKPDVRLIARTNGLDYVIHPTSCFPFATSLVIFDQFFTFLYLKPKQF